MRAGGGAGLGQTLNRVLSRVWPGAASSHAPSKCAGSWCRSPQPATAASVRVLHWVAPSGLVCVVRRTISAGSILGLRPPRGKSCSMAVAPALAQSLENATPRDPNANSQKAAGGPVPEGKTTAQLNAGDGLIGTGPYRFVSFVPNDRMVVTRNKSYWGKAPPWETVTMKVIASDSSRAAAMLAGEIDAALVPGENIDALKANPKVKVTVGDACFFTYLALDQHEPSPAITGADGKNPLKDARVRKALSLAINRQTIAERVMSGLAEPAAELGAPTLFGATPDAKPDPFDPEQAKKLLAEAGYPKGFGITLHSPKGLFPSDSQLAQAIASMWTRVGVRTEVESVSGSVFYSRRNKLEYSAYVTNACPYIGQMSYSLRILAMTRDPEKGNGQINVSTYANPKVDQLLTQAFGTIKDDARAKLVQEASKIVMQEERPVLAIIRHRYAYAVRSDLTFRPRVDTFLTAMQISASQ